MLEKKRSQRVKYHAKGLLHSINDLDGWLQVGDNVGIAEESWGGQSQRGERTQSIEGKFSIQMHERSHDFSSPLHFNNHQTVCFF